jgi:hypothetical protein
MPRTLSTLVAILLAIPGSTPSHSKPDYLGPAQKYGATNRGFCHVLPSGGHGTNERGSWLISERDRSGIAEIDVEWLSARDPLVEGEQTTKTPSAVVAKLPEIGELMTDRERPFDHSTRHGDWPAYGGDVLMSEARSLITGRALPEDQMQRLRAAVLATPGVEAVNQLASVYSGASEVLVDANLDLAEDLDTSQIEAVLDDVDARIRTAVPDTGRVRGLLNSPEASVEP